MGSAAPKSTSALVTSTNKIVTTAKGKLYFVSFDQGLKEDSLVIHIMRTFDAPAAFPYPLSQLTEHIYFVLPYGPWIFYQPESFQLVAF